jgi:predicted dehydrogenase
MSLRIGLVGCGVWGRLILRDLLKLGATVRVTCLDDGDAAFARQAGAAHAGADLPEADEVDAYVVATPTSTHAAVLDRVLDNGRPVFVEKSLTADAESARRLAERAPDRLFVMDKWRYHPGVEAMRREAQSGRLGRVLAMRTSRWQWANRHADVGPLWVLAPHDLSIILHVLGRLPPLRQAVAVVPGRPELGFLAVLADEQTQATVDVGVVATGHRRRCQVIGERATLELGDAYDDALSIRRGPPGAPDAEEETLPLSKEMPLEAELRAFLAHVGRAGPPPLSSALDGALVVERLAQIEAALQA